MRPAWSVILLTTLIGAGQGLFLALVTVQSYALVGVLPPVATPTWFVTGSALSLALLAGGLAASFFHLGRPERAWRSATQWRTSWLSREVIALPAFMLAVAVYGALHLLGGAAPLWTTAQGLAIPASLAVGALGTLLDFALFVCTGMIYACLPFLAEWRTPLTPLNYTLLGGASGFTLASALAGALEPELVGFVSGWAIVLTALGAAARGASLVRNAKLVPKSTIQSAIGVKHPSVAQRAMGFMGGSFNTREFFHGASPGRFRAVRQVFVLLAFVVPLILLGLARPERSAALLAAAFGVQYVGLLAERWFFFAQARHPQNLYYQAVS